MKGVPLLIDNTADFWLRYPKSIFARKAVMASLQINEIVIQFKASDLSNNEFSPLLAWYLVASVGLPQQFRCLTVGHSNL